MQLILDTESTVGVKRNMSAFNEETLVEKLDDVIQDLKSGICNSNKENIQSQDNIITADERELNSDNDKGNIEEISATKSPVPSEIIDTDIVIKRNEINNDETNENSAPEILIEQTQGALDEQEPSVATVDTVEQHACNESPDIVDQQDSSEPTVPADDQEPVSKKAFGVDQASNEETHSMNYRDVSSEKPLGIDCSQAAGEKFHVVDDPQTSNEENLSIDQQASCDKNLEVEDQQVDNGKCRDVYNPHSSSEEARTTIGDQQRPSDDSFGGISQISNEKSISIIEDQASCEENLNVDEHQASSEESSCLKYQQDSKEDILDNVIEELEKDDDSDPITIAYEEETSTVEKQNTKDEDQQADSTSKAPIQISEDILTTDNYAASNKVEIIELDGIEKEHSIENDLEIEKQKQTEGINIINDDLIINKIEAQVIEKDKQTLPSNKEINTEKELSMKSTESNNKISDNGDICDKKNKELICEKENVISMNDERGNRQEKSGTEDLQQTTINITSHNNIQDADVKFMDCENINEIEEKDECNKDMEVDDIIPEEDKIEKSSQNKLKTLSTENKINHETETQLHRNKLSEDLKNIPSVLKLSNTLDILSDDEDIEPPKYESQSNEVDNSVPKQCINIEDDDDIMLIDEDDTNNKDNKNEPVQIETDIANKPSKLDNQIIETPLDEKPVKDNVQKETKTETKSPQAQSDINEKASVESAAIKEEKPLVPNNFLKSYKKNLADMTREDLEEFCILKIVESIVDRSNLSDIKGKLKTMAQNIEEHKKKAMMLTKQNRDLQVVLKSVQEELKKSPGTAITPLKISRSVGMQVLMTEKPNMRRKGMGVPAQAVNGNNAPLSKSPRTPNPSPRPIKPVPASQTIPVPRLVPASNNVAKNVNTITPTNVNNSGKATSPLNGIKNTPVPKIAEKRPLNKAQGMTVDLTDDEPPAKVMSRSSPVAAPPVRLLHPLAQNSPRKVYIPISGPQGNIRPGQTIMLKTVPNQGPRPRGPIPTPRLPQNQIRMPRIQNRHPAPLPEVKQYQTNHYKALPPAPDLKLSKVENGIVISWKIEGYQEDSYEEIASYQLYAYQESSSPPSTALWKKIGDVKALPLPMACTLTQFMAGFKYYFAVRAVDVRSRFGPFSLPGSILLLNKI